MYLKSPKGARASWMGRMLGPALFGAAAFAVTAASAQVTEAEPSGTLETVEGMLADGTPYLLRRPSNWNRIVVTDLDRKARSDASVYQLLIESGYGMVRSGSRVLWDAACQLSDQSWDRHAGGR